MALPMFSNYTDPTQDDPRKTRKNLQQSAVSSMSAAAPVDGSTERTPAQEAAIQRRLKKKRSLSEDPYQNKPQG